MRLKGLEEEEEMEPDYRDFRSNMARVNKELDSDLGKDFMCFVNELCPDCVIAHLSTKMKYGFLLLLKGIEVLVVLVFGSLQ